MLELHRIGDLARDVGARLSRTFPSRCEHCAACFPRDASTGCSCPASHSTARAGGWATAAATTIACCRSFRRTRRASPARSRSRSSRRALRAARSHRRRDRHRVPRIVDAADDGRGRAARVAARPSRSPITLAIQIYVRSSRPPPRCSRRRSARDVRDRAEVVGVFVGLIYVGAMFASLACGGVHRALRRDPRVAGLRLLCAAGSRWSSSRWRPPDAVLALASSPR